MPEGALELVYFTDKVLECQWFQYFLWFFVRPTSLKSVPFQQTHLMRDWLIKKKTGTEQLYCFERKQKLWAIQIFRDNPYLYCLTGITTNGQYILAFQRPFCIASYVFLYLKAIYIQIRLILMLINQFLIFDMFRILCILTWRFTEPLL